MSVTKIVILDYGIGNLRSMKSAVLHAGGEAVVSRQPADLAASRGLILPGVGAFAMGMNNLRHFELVEPIRGYIASGRPVLGVCLGMQLMMSRSFEFGETEGLNLFVGDVRQMPVTRTTEIRLPHIAWARLTEPFPGRWRGTLLDNKDNGEPVFYFVHSYVPVPANGVDALAYARNGDCEFVAAIQRDNVTGMQFHPEKSGARGLAVLAEFVRRCAL